MQIFSPDRDNMEQLSARSWICALWLLATLEEQNCWTFACYSWPRAD